MARIRSIKPEFWTSEQIAECSPNARLMFVGLWTFSDDNGIHPASVARLKMEVFPADSFTRDQVGEMVQELIGAGLLEQYEVGTSSYWRVTGWERHQRIDQPTFKHPLPTGEIPTNVRRKFSESDSANVPRTFDSHSPPERSGEEWSGVDESKDKHPDGCLSETPAGPPPCPSKPIIEAYHEALPAAPRVRVLSKKAETHLRTRWREDAERQSVDWWRGYFDYVAKCPFLVGQKKDFVADFGWLVNPTNFAKVVNGNYDEGAR